jgi:Family of unknown function (DUF6444)
METASPPPDKSWPFPFSVLDWGQTPPSVQAYILQLQHDLRHLSTRVEALEARVNAMAVPSYRPPSSDSVSAQARLRSTPPRRNAGRRSGRPGRR